MWKNRSLSWEFSNPPRSSLLFVMGAHDDPCVVEEVQWSLLSSWENETSSPEILKIRPFFPAISVDLTDLNYHGHNIKGFFQNHYWTIDSLLYLQKFVWVFKNKHGKNEQMCLAHISHLVFHLLSSKEFMIVWKRLLGAFSSFSLVYMAWLSTFFRLGPSPKRLIIFVFKGPISR